MAKRNVPIGEMDILDSVSTGGFVHSSDTLLKRGKWFHRDSFLWVFPVFFVKSVDNQYVT
jgi:hypothetical protein